MENSKSASNVPEKIEPRTSTFADVFGVIKTDIKITIEEMNEIIAAAWAGER